MTCENCGEAMATFPICDWPAGYVPKHGERAARVTAAIGHCRNCGHQQEVTRDE